MTKRAQLRIAPNPQRRITQKQAETWIPPLAEMIGNYDLKEHLQGCLNHFRPGEDSNLLVEGPSGSGKTVALIAYLRERLEDPNLGYADEADFESYVRGKQ